MKFYDCTTLVMVLATSFAYCAHAVGVFLGHSLSFAFAPIAAYLPGAYSNTPTYPAVLTIVHSDGTPILSMLWHLGQWILSSFVGK